MNAPTMRALALDSVYQVLDNRVFRILAVLVFIPILATFVVGFREDNISVLFGWMTYEYESILGFLTQNSSVNFADDALRPYYQEMSISAAAELLIGVLGGSFGMMLSVAATAFFVPRMLEKGAADTLFHKPSRRMVFYIARYCAGLLFVTLISLVLVGGMYLGFLVASGYHFPRILWSSVTLIYAFGLVYSFSMLVGVFTRSTVASILLSLVFFMGTGCIHQIWTLKEFGQRHEAGDSSLLTAGESGGETLAEAVDIDEEVDDDEPSPVLGFFIRLLDVLHYGLPKTSDADYIARIIQRNADRERLAYFNEESGIVMPEVPPGFELTGEPAPALSSELADELGQANFSARSDTSSAATCSLTLRSRPRRELKSQRRDDPERTILETRLKAALALQAVVEEQPLQRDAERSTEKLFPLEAFPTATFATKLSWVDHTDGTPHSRMVYMMQGRDAILAVDIDAGPGYLESEDGAAFLEWLEHGIYVDSNISLDVSNTSNPDEYYSAVFGTRSPLKYNVYFSIASSLLFALLCLGLGVWKLSRIDF